MTRVRNHSPSRIPLAITVVLVASTHGICPPLAGRGLAQGPPHTVLERWERVESAFQDVGCRAARDLARQAIAVRPESPALLSQYVRTEIGIGGIGAAETCLDSLRTAGYGESALLAGEYAIAAALGQDGRAAEILARIEPLRRPDDSLAPTTDRMGLDELWLTLERARIAGASGSGVAPADSLLEELGTHPLLRGPPGFARAYLRLLVQQIRISSIARTQGFDAAYGAMMDLIETALARGFRGVAAEAAFHAGRIQVALQHWAEAADRFEQAATLAEGLGHVRWQALDYSYLGLSLEQQWRFSAALEYRRRAAAMLEDQEGDPVALAHALLGLGWSSWRVGDPVPAEEALRRARDLFRDAGNTWGEIQTLNNLALVHHYTDRRAAAMEIYEEALWKARATGNSVQEEMVLNNIGILHQEGKRPDLALPVYRDLLTRHRASGDVIAELGVLNNLALVSRDLGQTDQARILFEQCIERGEEGTRYYDTVPPRINLGHMLIAEGRYEEALPQLDRALEKAEAAGDGIQEADVKLELGNCLDLLDRPEQALEHLLEADRLLEDQGNLRVRIANQALLARVHAHLGQFEEALSASTRAESLATLLNDVAFIAFNQAKSSRILLLAGQPTRAWSEARAALRTWSEARRRSRVGVEQVSGFAFANAATTLLQCAGDLDPKDRRATVREVFEASQLFKTRALLEYVEAGQRRISPEIPDSLAQTERRTRLLVDRIRGDLEAPGLASSSLDSLRLALAEAETEHQNVRRLIFARDPRFAQAAVSAPLSLDEVRTALLTPGTLILDFVVPPVMNGVLTCPAFLFLLDGEGLRAHVLVDPAQLQDQISLLIDVLDSPPASATHAGTAEALLDVLSQTLLGPIAGELTSCRELIVSPDGVLHRVPFAALRLPARTDGTPDGSYLLQRMNVVTTPSLQALEHLRSAGRPSAEDWRWDLTIWCGPPSVAPRSKGGHDDPSSESMPELKPLRYAATERKNLLDRFAHARAVTAVPGNASSGGAPTGSFGGSRVVHFIAHGYFDDRWPWRSGLYLDSPVSTVPPRRLEIADVYAMDFRSQLVTLSACHMAKEELGTAIGWRGFAQALFGSGARSVLATLWAIDDASTPLFMLRFYENLAQGVSRSEALRRTQLSFLEDERLCHPFYWAPYVLLGEGQEGVPLARRSTWARLPLFLVSLGGFLLLVAARLRRREPRIG